MNTERVDFGAWLVGITPTVHRVVAMVLSLVALVIGVILLRTRLSLLGGRLPYVIHEV